MSERKVINKYYPPDFDPSKLPRGRKPKNNQVTVRMMMPMSVRCNTCGEYLYKGKKFNSKKETVIGEEYLGVKIFRFYMKCVNCSSEFTIKTDPENSDYVAEFGCSRNFEPWRANDQYKEEVKKKREEEETGDAMKALENRTNDSKVEMDIIEALDEIRSLNARNSRLDAEALWEAQKRKHDVLTEEDEKELNQIVFKNSTNYIQKIEDTQSPKPQIEIPPSAEKKKIKLTTKKPIIKVVKKEESDKKIEEPSISTKEKPSKSSIEQKSETKEESVSSFSLVDYD